MDSSKNVVVITGVGGFIGRQLALELQRRGFYVRGLDIFDPQTLPTGKYEGCDESFQVDITQPIVQNDTLCHACDGADVVYHLAAKVHALSEVAADDAEYERINVVGTQHVLEAAAAGNVRRFVLFSSIKVFGEKTVNSATQPISEEETPSPDTPYGRTKLKAEQLVLNGGANGLYVPEPVVLRLAMVYGSGAKGNMIPLIRAIRRGLPIWLPDFHNKRSMVEVRDVIMAAVLLCEQTSVSGVYTVTDGDTYSIGRILREIRMALGRKEPIFTIPAWCFRGLAKVGDCIGRIRRKRSLFDSDALNKLAGNAWFSSARLESELGFRSSWKLSDSLPEMIHEMERTQTLSK